MFRLYACNILGSFSDGAGYAGYATYSDETINLNRFHDVQLVTIDGT